MLIGEITVAALTSVAFLPFLGLLGEEFRYWTVITGSVLGAFVITLNFLILSVGINRAVDKFIEERGSKEMDEDEAEKFAADHKMVVQNAMMKSYLLRNLIMIGSLVLAGISGWFNIIAVAVPLLAYRPVMYAVEFIKTKIGKAGG
jgi:hypothetical protein